MHELCIFCGKCIEVCPVNAKKLRSDTARLKQLIKLNKRVFASLAPSFPAEFNCSTKTLISALLKLGFSAVSETAVGAEIIGRQIAERNFENKMLISSACPTVNELIRKYKPELTEFITDLVSPLQAHAAYLKETYGNEIKVVFIGPCIAKKLEADDDDSPVDLAVTFKELRELLEERGISLSEISETGVDFIPSDTITASEFAVEGGMLNTIRNNTSVIDPELVSCSGIKNIISSFDDILHVTQSGEGNSMFLEYLACEGGCISGKGMTSSAGHLVKRINILKYYRQKQMLSAGNRSVSCSRVKKSFYPDSVTVALYSEEQLTDVLISLNKTGKEDELNCGGCGYNTCRDFATALLDGKAETSMCVTNMRKLAEKKSNALMRALPLGAVITDRNNRILECNSKFLSLFSDVDQEMNDRIREHVEGLALESFIPECSLFNKIRVSALNMIEDRIRFSDRIYRAFVFRIGDEGMAGAVFQDITSPAVRKETIIKKTEEVIEKSLNSVQQIASLLGENAAETQLILSSLIESYNDAGSDR